MDALTLILETYAPLAGRHLIDIGCGPGHLARSLAGKGATVTGVDPGADAIAAARAEVPGSPVPGLSFERASAETLPFPDGHFDGAIILNALHHVPKPDAALAEAARVLKPGCPMVIVEPLAEGSFFAVLRPIEDETRVRAQAQAAIQAAIASGRFTCLSDVTFARRERFTALEPFLERVAAVDPARRGAIAANGAVIAETFAAAAERDGDGFVLIQPLRAHVLMPAAV